MKVKNYKLPESGIKVTLGLTWGDSVELTDLGELKPGTYTNKLIVMAIKKWDADKEINETNIKALDSEDGVFLAKKASELLNPVGFMEGKQNTDKPLKEKDQTQEKLEK